MPSAAGEGGPEKPKHSLELGVKGEIELLGKEVFGHPETPRVWLATLGPVGVLVGFLLNGI